MNKDILTQILSISLLIIFLAPCMLIGQQPAIREAARIGFPMPDFKLVSHQGEEISISQLKGKNILLLFPRGRFRNQWCRFCHYQYAELVELEQKLQFRKKYNLEVIQVLPYTKEEVKSWVKDFKRNLGEIEDWKNPPNPENLDQGTRNWMKTARATWPKKLDFDPTKDPLLFHILFDADRKVSIGLELFRTEWNLNRAEQNIPTIFIIDEEGIIRFKYISQTTMDRPSNEYILKFIERMIISE